ncbi:MAG: hypothetical protein KGL99_05245 [Burkholderiales bacterium]|nr:hypothetical protein [Burkholderiales bacterium]MDE2626539.1 hypothetical protein [Burkholderiales bacterium]
MALAVLMAAVAALGINAVHHKSAHAVHAPVAVMSAKLPDVPGAAPADASSPRSDPSVPSAGDALRGQTLPDSDQQPVAF